MRGSVTGDLYCHVAVETPVKPAARQKEILREFEAINEAGSRRAQPRSRSRSSTSSRPSSAETRSSRAQAAAPMPTPGATRSDAYDVVVIGAGAAGMMCAATAGQRGRRVLDRQARCARSARRSASTAAAGATSPTSARVRRRVGVIHPASCCCRNKHNYL